MKGSPEASEVMKDINSDTHVCMLSLASFAIFALGGNIFFIILAIFATGKNLSCSRISISR